MARKTLLISIKPRFAKMIFSGTKTVELRRKEPKVTSGDMILVYVSSPVMELTGSCQVEIVETDTPARLWPRISTKAGVSKAEFDAYFEGSEQAVAIHVHRPKTFKKPVGLDSLRDDHSLMPPQSFRYLDASLIPTGIA